MGALANTRGRSAISSLVINTSFELKKHLRRNRFLITMILAVVLPALYFTVLVIFGEMPDTYGQFMSGILGFINILVIVSAAIFAGDAVSGEFESKNALLSFPTPQRRSMIFAGKYTAAVLATSLSVVIYYMACALAGVMQYGSSALGTDILQSFGVAMLYTLSVVSVVFLVSSCIKRSMSSTIIGFFSFFMVMPMIAGVLSIAGIDPYFVLTHAADAIGDFFGSSQAVGPMANSSYAISTSMAIAVMAVYSVISVSLSMVIASRKRME